MDIKNTDIVAVVEKQDWLELADLVAELRKAGHRDFARKLGGILATIAVKDLAKLPLQVKGE